MTGDEAVALLEELRAAISGFRLDVEAIDDKIEAGARAFDLIPTARLNAVLRAGLVPGAEFAVEGRPGTCRFVGFTAGMGMRCELRNGERLDTDVFVVSDLLECGKLAILPGRKARGESAT